MEYPVEIEDDKLLLPEELRKWLKRGEKLVGYLEGDMFILKRQKVAKLSLIAESGTDTPEPSLEDIADEVHAHREEKRRMGGV